MDDPPARGESAKTQPRDQFGHFIDTTVDGSGENLVDVHIHNPLQRIYALLEQIKKHQETTFSMRVSIPLIAIPVILGILLGVGGFQLGRLLPGCAATFASQIGTFYTLNALPPKATHPIQTAFIKNEQGTYNLQLAAAIDPLPYHNQLVAVSGLVNQCTKTIVVDSPLNLARL